jgi:hypothetical protein
VLDAGLIERIVNGDEVGGRGIPGRKRLIEQRKATLAEYHVFPSEET